MTLLWVLFMLAALTFATGCELNEAGSAKKIAEASQKKWEVTATINAEGYGEPPDSIVVTARPK